MIIYDAAFPSEVESVFTVSTVLDKCDFLISDVFLESFCTWKPGAEAHPYNFPKGFFSIFNGQ